MTDAQRTVISMLRGVYPVISARMRLRFLCKLEDVAAITTISQQCQENTVDCYRKELDRIATENPTIEADYDNDLFQNLEQDELKDQQKLTRANSLLAAFAFRDSFELFKSISSESEPSNRPYFSLAVICLMQRKWFEAYRFGSKSNNNELSFVTKFAAARFSEANLDIMKAEMSRHPTDPRVISDLEFSTLAALTAIADATPDSCMNNIFPIVSRSFSNESSFFHFIQLFVSQQFGELLSRLSEIDNFLLLSYYGFHVIDKLKHAIELNIMKLFISTYTNYPLDLISKNLNLSQEKTKTILFELILTHAIDGKIDFVNHTYIGGFISSAQVETEILIDDSIAMRKKLTAVIMKEEYTHCTPAPKVRFDFLQPHTQFPQYQMPFAFDQDARHLSDTRRQTDFSSFMAPQRTPPTRTQSQATYSPSFRMTPSPRPSDDDDSTSHSE